MYRKNKNIKNVHKPVPKPAMEMEIQTSNTPRTPDIHNTAEIDPYHSGNLGNSP